MLDKDLTRFMPSLSRVRENQGSERKTLLEGWQAYFRFQCLRANGKRSALLPNQSNDGMWFLGYFLVLRKPLLVRFCFVLFCFVGIVEFSVFSIFCIIMSSGDCSRLQSQETYLFCKTFNLQLMYHFSFLFLANKLQTFAPLINYSPIVYNQLIGVLCTDFYVTKFIHYF